MSETYGEHSEAAAGALLHLLQAEVPSNPDREIILTCRQAAHDAIVDRLSYLSAHRPAPAPERRLQLSRVSAFPLEGLLQVTTAAPRISTAAAPSDVLGKAHHDSYHEAWSQAASSLLGATHALQAAEEQPWLVQPAAAWPVVGDSAAAVEALALLDDRLPWLDELGGRGIRLEEVRLVTGHCARQAEWWGTQPRIPDLAFAVGAGARGDAAPGRLIRGPADLAAAERSLGSSIEPVRGALSSAGPHMDAATAHHVAIGQRHLLVTLRDRIAGSPALQELGPQVSDSLRALNSLSSALGRVTTVDPAVRPNGRALWQIQEINRAVRRFDLADLEPRQMADLVAATQGAMSSYGRALRWEAHREDSVLRRIERKSIDGPAKLVRIGHKTRVIEHARTLANMAPAPSARLSTVGVPARRMVLQETLAATPPRRRPVSPFHRGGAIRG